MVVSQGCKEAEEFFKEFEKEIDAREEETKKPIKVVLKKHPKKSRYSEDILNKMERIRDLEEEVESLDLNNEFELALYNAKMSELDYVY